MTTRSLAEVAFEKALYAAWAASWRAYVAADNEGMVESLALASQRASYTMEDAKGALAAAWPGLESFV